MGRNKVVVGISGGVDSLSALILLKERYEVSAVSFIFSDNNKFDNIKKTCSDLNIPHEIIDLREEFKNTVIEFFLESIRENKTPNPCVFCNANMKFKYLFDYADEKGIEYVATGHYAKIEDGKLYSSIDDAKDQSYFLSYLKKEELQRIILPLEKYKKEDVYDIVKGLEYEKESQDICFANNLEEFLNENIKAEKGNIIENDKIIGEHKGLIHYTIGQRKGLDLPGGPFYIIGYKGNDLLVSKDKKDLEKKEIKLKNINKLGEYKEGDIILARIRAGSVLKEARIYKNKIEFLSPVSGVTPGQYCVFYKDSQVLGGGEIMI